MADTKTLYEVFEEMKKLKRKDFVAKRLKENDSFALRTILQGNFDKRIEFGFPEGAPPFEKNGDKVKLTRELVQKLGRCTKNAKGIPVAKEKIFIDFLEAINENDANLFCLMKDRKLSETYPGITESAVKEAFPNLF